jgi:acetylornithine deacetylase/succinyl-diaminopimelate desuccinylase-like protein
MGDIRLRNADLDWLRALMDVPSVSPLEGGDPEAVRQAQKILAEGAELHGVRSTWLTAPTVADLPETGVPQPVRDVADESFLAAQPSLLLAFGDAQPAERRIVLNFHVDTVGPHVPPRLVGRTLHGRGAIDDKGPGVAAIVGVARAFAEDPSLAVRVEVVVCSVPGEEGGAMGCYGTRWLVDQGVTGRLTIFAEPTGNRVLDACSAAMTPRITVTGADSTDDHPGDGHNATLALGFLAGYLGRGLAPLADRLGAKVCVSGLHSGHAHNRVYGSGQLLLNLAYFERGAGERLAAEVETLVAAAGPAFAAEHGNSSIARKLVEDWAEVVRLDWLKRDLPPLSNRDTEMESLLASVGLDRHDGIADGSAFTCDAIWASDSPGYTAICGPGHLDTNGAHTPGEHVELDALNDYATRIRDLVRRFGGNLT